MSLIIIAGFYGDLSSIDLRLNNLSRFESAVFQSILEQMAPYNGYPYSFIWLTGSRLSLYYSHVIISIN